MANTGKPLEKRIQEAGKLLLKSHPVFLDRIYDTFASGGILPVRPGDFYFLKEGVPWLIEAKSSDIEGHFLNRVKDLAEAPQIAYHRQWIRAGGRSLFIFHRTSEKVVEFWEGSMVINAYLKPRTRSATDPWRVCPYTVEGIAEALLSLT